MSHMREMSLRRIGEVLNAVDRCFLVGGSPGVKMAAGLAIELLTGYGLGGRPLPAKTKAKISFAVSVTILSASMDQVLVRASRRGLLLPREVLDDFTRSVHLEALRLSREVSGDDSAELALLGRPLSVELWDDDPEQVTICLNYLVIARAEAPDEVRVDSGWHYVDMHDLNLNELDPRESLAFSEMLSIMGFTNPYEMADEEQTPLDIYPAA